MALIVQKFGGTSLGNIERIQNVASIIKETQEKGHTVIPVVSAMAGVTNTLVKQACQFSQAVGTPAYDAIISTGEQISAGMLCLALQKLGIQAQPLTGGQSGIYTNNNYSRARIKRIDTACIFNLLNHGVVPVITGFQGITESGVITTLGRGGSDTTAVGVAAAVNAAECQIYTDIDGIYTADPRIVPDAQFIFKISYDQALELTTQGARVLHARSVEYAIAHGVKIRVLSSFGGERSTILEKGYVMEKNGATGVTQKNSVLQLRAKLKNKGLSTLVNLLASNDVVMDMVTLGDGKEFSCVVDNIDEVSLKDLLSQNKDLFLDASAEVSSHFGRVSLVGVGMRSDPNYFSHFIQYLEKNGVKYGDIELTEHRVSILVPQPRVEEVVSLLHQKFFSVDSQEVAQPQEV